MADASNLLKPMLARGELRCIGATTLDEHRKHIEKDPALERRFQKVIVEPTTVDETILILNNIKGKEVTPFILQYIAKHTGGESLEANIALIKHNAKLGAEIAKELVA